MSLTRIGWRAIVMAASVLALSIGLVAPASAGTGPGSAPYLAKDDAAYEQLGLDELDDGLDPIKLHCRAQDADRPIAGCVWRTDSSDVATFQLWRLQIRVDDAARVLVTEVGADTNEAVDTGVTAPAVYLYAVLGLDDTGEIVARSRVDRVRFRDPSIEHLRLECDKATDAVAATDTEPAVAPSIGCVWSPAEEVDVRAYNLYRSTHDGGRQLIATLGADTTGYVDEGVEAGVRYLYRVEGVDGSGATVALSRFDSAGCPKRDGTERDERRDERRDDRVEERDQRRDDRADGRDERPARKDREGESAADTDADATDIEATTPDTDDAIVAVTETNDDRDTERDDSQTRPEPDRHDRRERGR